jgi:transposase-like protein
MERKESLRIARNSDGIPSCILRIGREEWEKHIGRQAKSGKNIAAYCREFGLKENSFYNWRKRLGEKKAAGGFIRLDAGKSQTAEVIITTPNGYRVESASLEISVAAARSLARC